MKNTFFYIMILFLMINTSCKAQVVNLDREAHDFQAGNYYKDINNKLNPYVGTWLYTNGNNSLKIIIQKREHIYYSNSNYYEDYLVGEFQYIENGVEIINRLSLINDVNIGNHSIFGNWFLKPYLPPVCDECSSLVKRVSVSFQDPLKPYLMSRGYIGVNDDIEDEKLIFFIHVGTSDLPQDDSPTNTTVPEGKYILSKVP